AWERAGPCSIGAKGTKRDMTYALGSKSSLLVIALAAASFAGCGSNGETRIAGGTGGSKTTTTTGPGGTGGASTGGSSGGGGGSAAKCTSTMSYLVQDSNIDDVVVDAKYAYYTQNNGDDTMPGGVFRVPLAGGAKQLLTSSPQP